MDPMGISIRLYIIDYLVGGDWNHGILNDFPIILGISSSTLTNSMVFQRGRLKHQPDYHFIWIINIAKLTLKIVH